MLALKDARVHTIVDDQPLEDATVLVDDGVITDVGANVDVPNDATIYDADGNDVTPGLVDAHSHAGIVEWGMPEDADWDELLTPISPHVHARDGYHPRDEALQRAARGGVTSIGLLMGSANVLGGVTCAAKTHGNVTDEMVIREDGMKAALGENPKGMGGYPNEDQPPVSRPGIAAMLRQSLQDAKDYRHSKELAEANGDAFEVDLGMENLLRVLDGELRLRVHAHRADDIMTAIRIAEEYEIPHLSIEHGTEAHLVADELADRDIPVVLGPTLYSGRKYEVKNISLTTAKELHEAGVTFTLQTDAPVQPQGYLDVLATLAVREGVPESVALSAITKRPAALLGIDDKLGTLEMGTDADIVVWNGQALDATTKPTKVFVDGSLVFDADGHPDTTATQN